ncbi:uncharacterized protein VTP21DRAFT_9436 [Calcarisporiella thermophila]|uniref:uncharacterized protein n=1 Tax=Calcarisporiella thermophila TaxID=911321 RepID=UPI0037420928
MPEIEMSTCYNLSYFKEIMKELRKPDDNIMLRMNTTDTHSEQACAEFFQQLMNAYRTREDAINKCLKIMDAELDRKNKILAEDPDDYDIKDAVYAEETKRRWVANEVEVESIIRGRSLKVFKDKCRVFKIPPEYSRIFGQ